MNYQEIADKYRDQVKQKRSAVAAAEAHLVFLRQLRQTYLDERDKYRNIDGSINAERNQQWNSLTRKIFRIENKIASAEIELGRFSLGDAGINELMKKLKL